MGTKISLKGTFRHDSVLLFQARIEREEQERREQAEKEEEDHSKNLEDAKQGSCSHTFFLMSVAEATLLRTVLKDMKLLQLPLEL